MCICSNLNIFIYGEIFFMVLLAGAQTVGAFTLIKIINANNDTDHQGAL